MKNQKKTTVRLLYPIAIVVLIALIGFGIRLWKIDSAPKGALIDELHFGYLAHSLLETGADEHGQRLPLVFRGFGDQKLPAMAYLDLLPVFIFGLSILAIRIPSVVAGTLLILASYWLLRELSFSKRLSALGALITAVSPWTFFLSRFGFESNIALLLLVIGLAALFKALKSNVSTWFLVAGSALALTWYAYIAYRPVTALIWVCALGILVVRKKIKSKQFALLAGSFLLIIAPLFAPSIVGVNSTRFNQVGILSDPGLALRINENRTFCDMQYPRLLCDMVWNKPVLISRTLLERYLSTFSPNYLVSVGESDLTFLTVEGFAQLYPIFYPFFIIGVVGVFAAKNVFARYQRALLLVGVLFAPLPTILVGDPQKVRISMWYPFVLIAVLYGVDLVMQWLQKKYQPAMFALLVVTTSAFSFLYLTEYFSVHVTKNEYYYQSYLPSLHTYLQTLPQTSQIYFKPFYSDPLMFYAFYTKMPAKKYQELAKLGELESSGFQHTVELGRVFATNDSLESIGCKAVEKNVDAVFVTDQRIEGAQLLYEGKASNGVHSYVFVYNARSVITDNSCQN